MDDDGSGKALATFGAHQLGSLFSPRGHGMSADEAHRGGQLADGHNTVGKTRGKTRV